MIKTHRRVMEAVGATGPGDAVLLDTPYGFQENADDISTKAKEFFRASVGHPIDGRLAGATPDDDTVTRERALAAIADAKYVFAGPGSPTYALRQWEGSPLPQLLADKLRTGGAVTFASAAALTIGAATVPVYEVYKVGAEPFWAEGLDLLSEVGLHVALIPHYDNAEGGGHDTRFCYLGERRLSALEPELPDGAWVLGVDEHTALVIDIDAGTATVEGNGTVTVRRDGASEVFDAGTVIDLDELRPGSGPARSRRPLPSADGTGGDVAPVLNAGVGLTADVERLTARVRRRRRRPRPRRRGRRRARARAGHRRLVGRHAPVRRARPGPRRAAPDDRAPGRGRRRRRSRSPLGRRARTSRPCSPAGSPPAPPSSTTWPTSSATRWSTSASRCATRPTAPSGSCPTRLTGARIRFSRPRRRLLVSRSPQRGIAPIVQRPRTPAFHAGNTGSNPVGGAQQVSGPVVQFGVHAGLSSRRSRVQIPSGPPHRDQRRLVG